METSKPEKEDKDLKCDGMAQGCFEDFDALSAYMRGDDGYTDGRRRIVSGVLGTTRMHSSAGTQDTHGRVTTDY